MYHAYQGTIDYHGEDEAETLLEVRRTLIGGYGPFMWAASRVVERENTLISAALITRCNGQPFVAFSMTHPTFKRLGFARACVESAVNHLLSQGEHELQLVSTLGNVGAMALYRKLGFVPQQQA